MTIFEKNLQAIKEKDIILYQAVMEQKPEEENIQIEEFQAKNGTVISKIIKEEKQQVMNSQYNPEGEALKVAEKYAKVADYASMIFLGLGNGIIAGQIVKEMKPHTMCMFYEPSCTIFLHMLQVFDLTDIIVNPQVKIIVKTLNDKNLDENVSLLIRVDNYKVSTYDALPKYKVLFEEEYEKLGNGCSYRVKMIEANQVTCRKFGKIMAKNNIYNMRYLFQANCEMEFGQVFPTDMPVILVAAGPSLEKNVQLLKEAKGKALIIAVDAALKYLVEQGVKPDVAVCVDAGKAVSLFQNEEIWTIPLAIDSAVHYRIPELMPNNKFIYISSENAYYNKLFQLAGKTMYSMKNGGSVATIAFSLAYDWGFRRMILVGQDLALAPDKTHAGNDTRWMHRLQEELVPVKGYYDETVYTSPDYNAYREWFEMIIRETEGIEVINATEGGARIEGTVQMPLREVLDTFCDKTFDFETAIREMPSAFSIENKEQIIKMWEESVNRLKTLKQKLGKGLLLIDQGINKIKRRKYSAREIANINKKIDTIIEECEAMEEIYFVDCMIAEEEIDVLEDIYEVAADEATEYCRLLEKLKKYCTSMRSAVDEVQEMFLYILEPSEEKAE